MASPVSGLLFLPVTVPHWIATHIWAMVVGVIVWPFPGTAGGVILMFSEFKEFSPISQNSGMA